MTCRGSGERCGRLHAPTLASLRQPGHERRAEPRIVVEFRAAATSRWCRRSGNPTPGLSPGRPGPTLGSPERPKSRVRSSTTMRGRRVVRDPALRRLASVRAAWSSNAPASPRSPTRHCRHLRGVRDPESRRRVVTLTLSRLWSVPFRSHRRTGSRGPPTYRRRDEQGSTRWSNEVPLPAWRCMRASPARAASPTTCWRCALAARHHRATRHPVPVWRRSPQGVNFFFAPTLNATRAFPIRGYASGECAASVPSRAASSIALPLALVGRAIGHLPLGVDKSGSTCSPTPVTPGPPARRRASPAALRRTRAGGC